MMTLTYLTTGELSSRIQYEPRAMRDRLKDSVLLEGTLHQTFWRTKNPTSLGEGRKRDVQVRHSPVFCRCNRLAWRLSAQKMASYL